MQASWVVAFVFFYHGLVPKILYPSETELRMIEAHGLGMDALWVARFGGVIEIAVAICVLLFPKQGWPLFVCALILVGLIVDVAIFSTDLLTEAFNPVTLNLSVLALVIVALKERKGILT